jgi:hypothetical protein
MKVRLSLAATLLAGLMVACKPKPETPPPPPAPTGDAPAPTMPPSETPPPEDTPAAPAQPSPSASAPSTSAPSTAAPAGTAKPSATPDAKSGDAKAGDAPKADAKPAADAKNDAAAWKKRRETIETALERAKTFAEALQSRINALANEYTNQGDGVRQQAIAVERQKAIADLDRLNKEIAQHTKELADLQEEARKSGVPPGWLR